MDGIRVPIAGRGVQFLVIGEPYLSLHINLCGNPGMGKTTIQIAMLEEVERRGEIAIIAGDPKAEYFERFFDRDRGDWNVDPASDDCCYWAVERESLDRAMAAPWGWSFIPDPPGSDHNFFPQNSRIALEGLLAAHNEYRRPDDPCTCENLAKWLSVGEAELLQRLARIPGTTAFSPKAQPQLQGLTGTLGPLAPSFGMMPRKSEMRREFTVREWADERDGSWIFFTSTPTTRDASRPVQTAIVDSLLRAIERRVAGSPRIWVFVDELSLWKRMSSLIESAALQRASNNPLVLGFQNSAQIELLYGDAGMRALLGMAYTNIGFASTDPKIQKHLEEQCGYAEIERISENVPAHVLFGNKHARSSSFTSQQSTHEPIMMATEIGGMEPYEFFIKQRDMVVRGVTRPSDLAPVNIYQRRMIPEMPIAISPSEEEPVALDQPEVIDLINGSEPEKEDDDITRAAAVIADVMGNMLMAMNKAGVESKRGGRPKKEGAGPGLFFQQGADNGQAIDP